MSSRRVLRSAAALCVAAALSGAPAPATALPHPAAAADPDCSSPTVTVTNADELARAIEAPAPGTVIALADGQYVGKFTARGGDQSRPIRVCAGPGAVLDGGGMDSGYVLHLDHAENWYISGLTVRNGKKGVVVDASRLILLDAITVTDIGEEGVHLRAGTSYSTLWGSTIRKTGLTEPGYGEGAYVGSALNHWCDYGNGCGPDKSDYNLIANNRFEETAAESVDMKEGTTGGTLAGNIFDGSALSGANSADSVLDAKGNGWLIEGNRVINPPPDPFQVHQRVEGWGLDNTFQDNYQQAS